MGNFRKCPSSVVVVKKNRNWIENVRMAIRAVALAPLATIKIIEGPLEITHNNQVQAAVIVVVQPGSTGRPARTRDSRSLTYIGKGPIAVVVVEGTSAISG